MRTTLSTRPVKRDRRASLTISMALALVIAPFVNAPASAAPPLCSWSSSAGRALGVGDGASQLTWGQTVQLDAQRSIGHSSTWVMGLSYDRLGGKEAERPLQFFNGGRLYLPTAPALTSRNRLRNLALEFGLRHGWSVGTLRPFVEARLGASWVQQEELPTAVWNDRRPDPSLRSSGATTRNLSPALGLGTGLEVRGPFRLALMVSASGRWSAAHDFSGPVIPVRVGAVWPVADDTSPRVAKDSPLDPRLRVAAGTLSLRSPSELRSDSGHALSLSVELEIPLHRGLAVSFAGDRHQVDTGSRIVVRQELDPFGNLVNVYSDDGRLSFTTTVVTAGLRVSHPVAGLIGSLRAGAGWGRTGGFGRTYDTSAGAYIDPVTGQLVPITQTVSVGGGLPRTGLGFSSTASLEVRVVGPLGAFVDVGGTILMLSGDDVVTVPVRAGLALR